MKTFLKLVKIMNSIKTIFLFFLISHIFWILPSFCITNYDHVLYYKQFDKYKLLIAFPENNPDSSKGVLFYDDNWYLERYSNSQDIRDFFGAIGFKDKDSRLKFRQKFQPDAAYDRFTSWNWQALFDWLSDMEIQEIGEISILMKEFSPVEYDSLDKVFKRRDYFPVFKNLENYLPKLDVEVNNLKTTHIEFGEVEIGTQKKLDVILTVKNINKSILFISPICEKYLDNSITVNKLNKTILLFNEIPDTLEVVFSPSGSLTESKFWYNDTLNLIIPLIGDFLPEQVNLFISGVRKKRINKIVYFVTQNSKNIVIIIASIIIIGIIFLLYRRFIYKKQPAIKDFQIPEIDFNNSKYREISSSKPIKKDSPSHPQKNTNFRFLQIKAIIFTKQLKQLWVEFKNKNKLSSEDVSLINNIQRLYYNENADIPEFIKTIQIYFGQDKDQNKKLFKAQFTENHKIKEKDLVIEKLQWYKEFFQLLKKVSGNKGLDDSSVKKVLIEKARFSHPNEVYSAIEKYCYVPLLENYDKFDSNKSIAENINTFQKNREYLLKQRRQTEELLKINEEYIHFIDGIKQGHINIKIETDHLQNVQIDYEQFLTIQKLCTNVIDDLYSFLKTIVDQLNSIDRNKISESWLRIIDNIFTGVSGLTGIKGCLERLHSFRNPLVLVNFLEINDKAKLNSLNSNKIKIQFRDRLILQPFCLPYLLDLRRLFLYLEKKEGRDHNDNNLFVIVKLLTVPFCERICNIIPNCGSIWVGICVFLIISIRSLL